MVQAVTPDPPDSGGEVGGQHEPNSIPVPEHDGLSVSGDEWQQMMAGAMMVDAESGSEKEDAALEAAVFAVETAAKKSFVYIFLSTCIHCTYLLHLPISELNQLDGVNIHYFPL